MKNLMPRYKFNIVSAWRRRRAFVRDERGVTAIEFGLLALPFFALIFAIMETALIFLVSNIFESAVHDSSRFIRTGQHFTQELFRADICGRTYGFFDCDRIKIRVRTLDAFQSAALTPAIDPIDASWMLVEEYDPGIRKSIMIAEAYYKWDTIVDFMGFNLTNSSDGTLLMGAAEVWRNEPF